MFPVYNRPLFPNVMVRVVSKTAPDGPLPAIMNGTAKDRLKHLYERLKDTGNKQITPSKVTLLISHL